MLQNLLFAAVKIVALRVLKGTATLMITMFYMKDLKKTMNFDTSFI